MVPEIDELMHSIANLPRRIAGKSIPLEKFVSRKSRKYFMQNSWLFLPAFEFMFVWSGIKILKGKAKEAMQLIEKELGKSCYLFRFGFF